MRFNRFNSLFFSGLILASLFCFVPTVSGVIDHDYPRLANLYLSWDLTESTARELAKWDVVVLDMEVQKKVPGLLKKMRQWNPEIVLLVYVSPQEIRTDAAVGYSQMRRELAAGLSDHWYLRDTQGKKLSWWPGTYLLNVTEASGWPAHLTEFVSTKILATGLWDGVFYDNAWDNITWFAGAKVDTDNNGQIDTNANQRWQTGMKNIYNETRRLAGNQYVLVGNNETTYYAKELNGMLLENFSIINWPNYLGRYAYNNDERRSPQVNLINSNTNNTGQAADYQKMRFGLTSTLLQDGYFSFDYGDQNHGQTWWYDEYNVDLGQPVTESGIESGMGDIKKGVWKRSFENGLAVVNSADTAQIVDLGGEYEKIHGTQDPDINDGEIVNETRVEAADGLILLKTFSSLDEILFRNGDFLRFFNPEGQRIRNGLFVFEEDYAGGDQIIRTDLDGNGKKDLLVAHKNRIMGWRDDGQLYLRLYPYTASYTGQLKIAVGDLNNDGGKEIYVAPSAGYALPLKVYNRHGRQMRQDQYLLGSGYKGGYSLGVANIDGTGQQELLIGVGKDVEPRVTVWDYQLTKLQEWSAYESWFRGGVNIAGGDVNGDGQDEVIVGPGPGSFPLIRVYSGTGKLLYKEFVPYQSLTKTGTEVLTADVDYDGVVDIVTMSSGF
ncbi:MAG TPA: putative glycoside hydrolase [Patescibacteria group bacterium]|nr:putative glycoside hydrolase [Patescibacteria group bacterium]